jgi:hypothetical protein
VTRWRSVRTSRFETRRLFLDDPISGALLVLLLPSMQRHNMSMFAPGLNTSSGRLAQVTGEWKDTLYDPLNLSLTIKQQTWTVSRA